MPTSPKQPIEPDPAGRAKERVSSMQPRGQPVRIWTFSDLHLEWPENAWDPVPPPAFDAVVAAGDVARPLPKALGWLHDRFPGVPTVYVPGNHDFWNTAGQPGRPWTDILAEGRDVAARWNIRLLSDDSVVIHGTRFIGATLWTDFRWGHDHAVDGFGSARRDFNDYRRIRRPSGRTPCGRPIRPAAIFDLHRASRSFLNGALAIAHAGPTVVVTHHAPHPNSVANRPDDGLDHVYCSDLTPIIHVHAPALWVHGHVHGVADYRVGGTRIVANARGHVDEASALAFDPQLVVEA